ncbi:MAG TPA: hypothetical protein PLT68_04720 [Actinomycetota bacterium]|nr:hypothetical protein [Actinomycetota bacterium]
MSKHPIDLLSLGAGLMFTLFAVGYLVAPASMSLVVVVPLMFVGLGLFGVFAAVVAQRRQPQPQPQPDNG